jgi:hypothetical protein
MMTVFKQLGVCVAVALLVAGCVGAGKGPSDEELIRMTADNVKAALEAKNLDLLLSTFAEDFEHPEVGGKEEARGMLQMGLDSGYADDGEVSLENMEIKINDDGTATVYPVDLSGPPGSISVELVLGKREITNADGKKQPAWLITTINADGI